MHVVIVSRRFPPQIGGAETAVGRLARGLARRGHRVTVVSEARCQDTAERIVSAWAEAAPRASEGAGVQVMPLVTSSARFWGTHRWMRSLSATLKALAGSCDLFYVSMLKHGAYVAMGVGKRRHVPVVLRPSGTGATGDVQWQGRSVFGRIVRSRCRKAAALIAVSPQMREELVAAGYPEQAVRLVPGGVPIPVTAYDPSATAPFRRQLSLDDREGPWAVYVGRFSAEKGLGDLVDAWAGVVAREPRARLTLAGEGPMRERLEQQVRSGGIETHVRFCGPTNDPEPYLRAADLFVLPSLHEGMSNALLEAMALGMPAVASDISGNRVAADDGRCAALVPAGQPERLAEAVVELFADPERRRALGQAARAHVGERFNLERVLDEHEQLFAEVLARG